MPKVTSGSPLDALTYLKERAQSAHLDGNGVLVNHLAAIALQQVRTAQSSPTVTSIPVSSWAWAAIFALYWLTDSYMLYEVDETLSKAGASTASDKALLDLLRAYDWLVRQPLDAECEKQKTAFRNSTVDWTKWTDAAEFEVLLTHAIELLWVRDPRGTDWAEVGRELGAKVPDGLRKRLAAITRRLGVQTSFAVLGAPLVTDLSVDPDWDTAPWVPQLWRCVFECDFKGVEQILTAESPRHTTTTPAARLLFDMRHYNRLRGVFGDPQAIGLTRRRLITTLSPELVFHGIREERASHVVSELYFGAGHASDRFFGFSIAMLLELAALRRWDLTAWCDAVEFQARLNAEVVARESTQADFADRAIRCAVGAFRLDEKAKWIEPAMARLEFLPEPKLTALVHDLLQARPVQYHRVKQVIMKIGDAIPPALYTPAATWSVRYVEHTAKVDRFGGSIQQIEFLLPLLSVLPTDHEAWDILWPIIEFLFRAPLVWQVDHGQLLRRVLTNAPLRLAASGVDLMVGTSADEGGKRARWQLLRTAAERRPDLGKERAQEIVNSAPLQEDLACLRDDEWAKSYVKIDDAAVRAKAFAHLDRILQKSVVAERQKEFELMPFGWELMFFVRWREDELPWVQRLIDAIENPKVLSGHLDLLLTYLRAMSAEGPNSFAKKVAPHLLEWLKHPPFGIDPMERQSGVFSTFIYNSRTHPSILEELAQLAGTLRSKIGNSIDASLIQYLMRIAAQPPVGITGAAMKLTLDLALDHPEKRSELLFISQALLLAAQLRATTEPSASEELMDGFRYPTWFASPTREKVVPREAVLELVQKIEPLVVAAVKSGTPRVRGQVAAFLAALKARDCLTPDLSATFDLLLGDPRASVRDFVTGIL